MYYFFLEGATTGLLAPVSIIPTSSNDSGARPFQFSHHDCSARPLDSFHSKQLLEYSRSVFSTTSNQSSASPVRFFPQHAICLECEPTSFLTMPSMTRGPALLIISTSQKFECWSTRVLALVSFFHKEQLFASFFCSTTSEESRARSIQSFHNEQCLECSPF